MVHVSNQVTELWGALATQAAGAVEALYPDGAAAEVRSKLWGHLSAITELDDDSSDPFPGLAKLLDTALAGRPAYSTGFDPDTRQELIERAAWKIDIAESGPSISAPRKDCSREGAAWIVLLMGSGEFSTEYIGMGLVHCRFVAWVISAAHDVDALARLRDLLETLSLLCESTSTWYDVMVLRRCILHRLGLPGDIASLLSRRDDLRHDAPKLSQQCAAGLEEAQTGFDDDLLQALSSPEEQTAVLAFMRELCQEVQAHVQQRGESPRSHPTEQ